MTITTLPAITHVPSRSMDEDVFVQNADAFLGQDLVAIVAAYNANVDELNAIPGLADDASDSAAIAIAAANFKGNWASLTGPLLVPASVYHTGTASYWMLQADAADVTAIVPGVSSQWKLIPLPADPSGAAVLSTLEITATGVQGWVAPRGVVGKSSGFTMAQADHGKFFDLTASGATPTFPAASTLGAGWSVTLRNSSASNITLDPNGSELIDGVTSGPIAPGMTLRLVCSGTAFDVVRLGGPVLAQVLTSGTSWVAPLGVRLVRLRMTGAGGGGQGGSTSGSSNGLCGGTAAYLEAIFPVVPGTSYTFALGAAGTGGAAGGPSGTHGTAGGNTTFTANGVTYTANGGVASSSTSAATASNGHINLSGAPSTPNSSTLSRVGQSPLGMAGVQLSDSAVLQSDGYGCGGVGGNGTTGGSTDGQNGRPAEIILEY